MGDQPAVLGQEDPGGVHRLPLAAAVTGDQGGRGAVQPVQLAFHPEPGFGEMGQLCPADRRGDLLGERLVVCDRGGGRRDGALGDRGWKTTRSSPAPSGQYWGSKVEPYSR